MIKFLSVLFVSSIVTLYATSLPLYFSGNKTISSTELYEALSIEVPYFYEFYKDKPSINVKTVAFSSVALENYYKKKGFYHAKVTSSQNVNGVTMDIEENVPVLIDSVSVVSSINIKNNIPLSKGDRFDADEFSKSKKAILELYSNQSYCNASLDAKTWIDTDTNKAYLSYDISPNKACYFSTIDINSSKNIDSAIIKPLLYIEENKAFSLQDITYSYESLYGYDGISKATINTIIENGNQVRVEVKIKENEKPIRFQTGLGYSSDEGLMASLGVKHRNFNGNLKTLGFDTRVTQIKQTLKAFYEMPFVTHNALGAEIGFENEKFIGFDERRIVATTHTKQRRRPHSFQEELVLDRTDTYNSQDLELFPEGTLFIVSPRFVYGYDSRDKILDPKEGSFIDASIMGSIKGSISDASYYKYKLSGGYIFSFKKSTIGLKADFGSLKIYDGELPASYRFFTGGMYSNRAYSYRKLGPRNDDGDPVGSDSVLNTTLEYRFDIYKQFKGVIFNDNTFIGNSEIPNYANGYYSAGVGLRYKTPIGPLAVDVGFNLDNPREDYAFHFHIGELF